MWRLHNSGMTHILPLRPLTQRNPAWRLYGDSLVAIDAIISWQGDGVRQRSMTTRCRLTAGRCVRAQRAASIIVRFDALLPRTLA